MSTILGNGISIRGGNSRAGARISTTLNDDGTQNVFIEDNVNTIIDTAKSIFSVSYNKVLVPLVGGSTPSGKLEFTYTGEYNERDDGVVELLTSGELMFNKSQKIDIFCVGGGGAGGTHTYNNYSAGGGGGGGYTTTEKNRTINANQTYAVTIGAGGTVNISSSGTGGNGGATSFGDIVANGGTGGGAGTRNNTTGGTGGTNGGNGSAGSDNSGGTGQGTTTREFGESTGKLYAGGGGGGRYSSSQAISTGGEGGGGNGGWCSSQSSYILATAGQANTGGGGGGGSSTGGSTSTVSHRPGGAGGSGIVCLRLHKETSPTTIPLTGDLAVGNTVTYDDKSFVVVHNEGTKWYLAKEYITDQTTFSNKTPALYNDSTVASMCNTYLTQFSDNAKKYMVDVTVEGVTNKVFVPTHDQVNGGFSWYNSNANRTVKRDVDKVNMSWWTSSSSNNSNLLYTIEGGSSLSTGSIITKIYDHTLGVRPHICIDTSLSG